jgi:hypothetical protein
MADHLANGQLRGLGREGLLGHDPDPGAPRSPGPLWILAEHRRRAAVPVAVALEDLHGGRLARTIGPEQGKHLAAADRDVDPG